SRAPRLEFSLEGLPWLDRLAPEVRAYVDRLSPAPEDPDLLYGRLMHWAQFGYVVLPGAIETELIDGLLEDVKELFEEHTKHRVLIDSDVIKGRPICEVPEERMVLQRQGRGDIHMRVLDFVHYSIAAKKISLHSSIAGFLQHVMRARLVVLQSLNFFQGSEQLIHQDYAFVPAKIPSQLAA